MKKLREIIEYVLPFKRGGVRRGMLVREGGRWGEVAPLVGWSAESYDEAKRALEEGGYLPASVRFGQDGVSDLRIDSKSITRLVEEPEKESKGYRPGERVKIKIGHLTCDAAVEVIQSARASGALIALDICRKWDLAEALRFASHFAPEDFVYIEDPVNAFTELESFYLQSGMHYALDNHLLFHPLKRILALQGLTHLIIKPTLHGGLADCKRIVEEAAPLACIFGSSYESPIGLAQIAHLSALLSPGAPLGIDTLPLFEEAPLAALLAQIS